ncbi:MAG: response regulator transcription factor [Planctomycetota bacterium]
MSAPIRVLLVDDQPLLREGLRLIFELQDDFEVVGEAGDGEAALELVANEDVDVVLMDVQMPGMDGVAATRELRQRYGDVQVIILTTFDDDDYVFEGLRAGACGYLLKDVSSERLLEATRAAARGESFLQPSIAAKVVAEFSRVSDPVARRAAGNAQLENPLSNRELEILEQLAEERSNREVAAAVHLSEGTVKNHITSILGKLGVGDRKAAVTAARERRLLPPGHGRR